MAKRKRTDRTAWNRRTRATRLLDGLLATRSPRTAAVYRSDLRTLAAFLGVSGELAAVREFLKLSRGRAAEMIDQYLAWLRARGYADATVAGKIATVRSLSRKAKDYQFTAWRLDKRVRRGLPSRPTAGPTRAEFDRMLAYAQVRDDRKGLRDAAILRLLHDLALRAAEVLSLRVEDVDVYKAKLRVLRKGNRQRVEKDLPIETAEALGLWLVTLSRREGPLFVSLSNRNSGKPLTYWGLYAAVVAIGRAVGVEARPHGFRHTATTEAGTLTGGNLRLVAAFTDHQSIGMVARYDDRQRRREDAAHVAQLVASGRADPLSNPGPESGLSAELVASLRGRNSSTEADSRHD